MRRKKILNISNPEKVEEEWKKIRKNVMQWVNDSMNTPADEARFNWLSLIRDADMETRWVRVEVWQKRENEHSSDQGKYKIYVFHNQDAPADFLKKLNENLINDERGNWKEPTIIDEDKDLLLEWRKLPNICDETEKVEQTQAQILQTSKTGQE